MIKNSSYKKEDVTLLFKDVTGMVSPQSNEEREKSIQSGTHYCEMLPIEYEPTKDYLDIYYRSLNEHSKLCAKAVGVVADKIFAEKKNPVLVSLARAGTSIGVLIKRYLENKYKINVPHFSISIIRGKGIDKNAMQYILDRYDASQIQFVDGWTGKGAIQNQLNDALKDYPDIDNQLAVLSDPANVTKLAGTHIDFLIPSSCLNSPVSGLISRTFLRSDIIKDMDFHGVVVYKELSNEDHTYEFINKVIDFFDYGTNEIDDIVSSYKGYEEANEIAHEFGIDDINLVKPSIGETTRVLLRRVPWKILVYSLNDEKNLGHIYQLANEKKVEIVEYPLKNYKACGLIKKMGDI